MPYKSLLTFINTTVIRSNELLPLAESVFLKFIFVNFISSENALMLANLFILWQKKKLFCVALIS